MHFVGLDEGAEVVGVGRGVDLMGMLIELQIILLAIAQGWG